MYQVLARKWRPRNFDELVGQSQIARTLSNAVEKDRLAHAYVFAGLRGTGKTSTARILAKNLNCEQGPTTTPCDRCTPCTEIAENRAIDVMELDAASRTGVDDIRELQELINYPPVRDRYKLLIVDEAHMLSKQAFNALLKTLEEPPPRVIFVLATTELQKVLPTILSRCQVFEFRRVSVRDVAAHLERICEKEKIAISAGTVERIARAGEGSVRDSLSLLERVIAFCGDEVLEDDALRVLGTVRGEVVVRVLGQMAQRDAAGLLLELDGLAAEGHDLVHFWGELIAGLRDVMLLRAAPDSADLLLRPEDESRAMAEATAALSAEDLDRAFAVLADLETGLKGSSHPRFLFEAALIRIANLGAVRPIEEMLAGLGQGPGPQGGPKGGGSRRKPSARVTHPPRGPATTNPAAPAPPAPAAGDLRDALVAAVQERKPMLAAILGGACGVRAEEGTLCVSLPASQAGMRAPLEREDNRDLLLEAAVPLAGGGALRLRVEVADATEQPEAPGPQPAAAAAPPAAPPAASPRAARRASDGGGESGSNDLAARARAEPGVSKLLHEFGAQVVDIRKDGGEA